MTIFITQLIYIKSGSEIIFDEFERIAIPIISNYHGKLLLRVRPSDAQFIEGSFDKPYEIHLIEFESEDWFKKFMADETRKKYLHLKEASIEASLLIQGQKI